MERERQRRFIQIGFVDPLDTPAKKKQLVALRRAFREILPLLWLKSGAIGPRPELPREAPEPALFVPPGNAFAVLFDESRLADLIEALSGRTDLRMLFVVTDARESFKELSAELEDALGPQNPGLRIVQLYRDYLENFMINREPTGVARFGQGAVRGRDTGAMKRLEARAETAFDHLYDRFKGQVGALPEGRRQRYERLRLATAKPVETPWDLPDSIDFRRTPGAPRYERHLYLEDDGHFRADLGTWEAGVLAEELADPEVVGWLRNQDRKPWSLEIPYDHGGAVRPMFPDLVIVRGATEGEGFRFDIMEPHDPSLGDNVGKAVGLARFAERHGHLFGRIQLIRRRHSPAGGDAFFRLEINRTAMQKKLLLVTTNPQLDALFAAEAMSVGPTSG